MALHIGLIWAYWGFTHSSIVQKRQWYAMVLSMTDAGAHKMELHTLPKALAWSAPVAWANKDSYCARGAKGQPKGCFPSSVTVYTGLNKQQTEKDTIRQTEKDTRRQHNSLFIWLSRGITQYIVHICALYAHIVFWAYCALLSPILLSRINCNLWQIKWEEANAARGWTGGWVSIVQCFEMTLNLGFHMHINFDLGTMKHTSTTVML